MRGVRARYDAVLPPNISIVRHPGRPVISGMETSFARWKCRKRAEYCFRRELSGPMRLRVQMAIAIEDAVDNRGLCRVFVLRFF